MIQLHDTATGCVCQQENTIIFWWFLLNKKGHQINLMPFSPFGGF